MRFSSSLLIIFVFILYFVIPIALMFSVRFTKKLNKSLWIFLLLFFFVLIIGVLGKVDFNKTTIFIGFDFSGSWFSKNIIYNFKTTKVDRLINLLMLMPIGSLICIISKYKNIKHGLALSLFVGMAVGSLIEFFQYLLPVQRVVQLVDILYNAISTVIGYIYLSCAYYFSLLIKNVNKKRG